MSIAKPTSEYIRQLADPDAERRAHAAFDLSRNGAARAADFLAGWMKDEEFRALVVQEKSAHQSGEGDLVVRLTTGIAVSPETFKNIRAANGSPALADVPADQDALEFELEFEKKSMPPARLDILTTNAPGANGAIARFLAKFGEGIQQIEIDVKNVDRATEILHAQFKQDTIYPATRPGANGTRVNFFLVPDATQKKVLVELVEQPRNH